MIKKRVAALSTGVICLIILVGALVWALFRPSSRVPDQSGEQPAESGQNTQSTDAGQQTDSNNNETAEPENNEGKNNAGSATKADIEAILKDPFMLLVNRENKVSSDYQPSDLITFSGNYQLNQTCADALHQLIAAGKEAGYNYTLYSAYRSYSTQYNKYNNKITSYVAAGKTEEEATRLTNQYYAPPGASEHHTGLAADVCIPSIINKYGSLHEGYDQTPEFAWFSAHAHEYGFILRYPKGAETITGYSYEPWHYRYVGTRIATEIYNRGITLEEYIADLQSQLQADDK